MLGGTTLITAPRIPGRLGSTIPIEYSFPLFGRGHKTDIEPGSIPAGFTIRTWDVNLDGIGGVQQRGGIEFMAENGACALQIATGEEAGWDGGSTSDSTVDGSGIPRFRAFDTDGPGTASRRITGTGTLHSILTLPVVMDTDTDVNETLGWWVYVDDPTKVTSVSVAFATDGAFANRHSSPAQTVKTTQGWNFYTVKRRDFVATGAPDWRAVGFVRITLVASAATFVTFDNIWLGPAHVYGLWNFRRSLAKGGGNWILAAARDGLSVYVPEEQRFRIFPGLGERGIVAGAAAATVTLAATADARERYYVGRSIKIETGTGIGEVKTIIAYDAVMKIATVDSAWGIAPVINASRYIIGERTKGVVTNFLALNDVAIAMNGVDPVESIYDDRTSYTTGIVKPGNAPAVAQQAGFGAIPVTAAGTFHTVAVVFYSDITGREGDPILTAPFTIAANNTRLTYTNLPVAIDAKVGYLRIYRLAPGQPAYKRTSAELLGEVTNGTTTFQEGLAATALGNELDGEPNFDIKGVPPRARFAAVVNSHVIYDDPAAAGRVIVSTQQTAEEVPIDGIVALDEGDNDDNKGIGNIGGIAVVFKQDGFQPGRYVGGGRQPFAFQKRESKIGTNSHRSIISGEGFVRFRHTTGYYQMGLNFVPQKIGGGWDKRSKLPMAEPSLQDFDNASAEFICSAFITNRDQVYWCETVTGGLYPSVQPVLHEPLMGDPDDTVNGDGGWAFHRAPVSVITQARDAVTHDELIVGCGAAGILYRFDRGFNNDLTPNGSVMIDYDAQTPFQDQREKQFGMGPSVLKRYKWADLVLRPDGNWPLDVEVYYDWGIGQGQGVDGGTVASSTALTVVLVAGPSEQNDFFNGLRIQVVNLATGVTQERGVIDYDGPNRRIYIDSAWTVNPSAADEWVCFRRLYDTGTITPNLGPGLGDTFALGLSPMGGAGGYYGRLALPIGKGRHRSASVRFRNNRLDEAPHVGSLYLHVIRQRAAGRIS